MIVSDTATALIPPSTAYSAPIIPTSTIRIVSAIPSLIPNTVAKSKICSNAIAPAYRHTGIPITKYPIRNRIETIRRTPTPYLSSINSGSVVYPFLRYIGKNTKAIIIVAITAVASHAIPDILAAYDCPDKPTRFSADRFVSSIEPAIKKPPSPFPARKYPFAVFWSSLFFTIFPEIIPTSAVKSTNVTKVNTKCSIKSSNLIEKYTSIC